MKASSLSKKSPTLTLILPCFLLQADVALLHDTALVILDAFSRLLKSKPDLFRNNTRRGEIYNRGQRGVDCQNNPTIPWEHGEIIIDYLRAVSGEH